MIKKFHFFIVQLLSIIPLLFLLSLITFFMWVTFNEGQFPTYGNPDPQFYPLFHFIVSVLLLFVPISLITWLGKMVLQISHVGWKAITHSLLLELLVFTLLLLLITFDPMGMLNWLLD